MPKQPEERYLEWLDRVEEKLGSEYMERATLDVDTFKRMLEDELTTEGMEAGAGRFVEMAIDKYEIYPKIGARYETLWHPTRLFSQPVYRIKGKFASYEQVQTLKAKYLGFPF